MQNESTPTAEQLYRKNKRKVKIFSRLAPITWWVFVTLTVIFVALALENSVGNVLTILEMLDDEQYSAAEIRANYATLAEQWGEWELVGEDNSLFAIRYINVANAMFSGLMKTYFGLAVTFFALAISLGKVVFPAVAKSCDGNNTELVNLAALRSAEKIDEITTNRKEWF